MPHQFNVEAAASLNTGLNEFSFGNLALYDLKYSAAVVITIDETSPYYMFRINLEEQCQVKHEQNQVLQSHGIMTVTHPHIQNRIMINHRCRNIILKLTQQDVETQLCKMLGYTGTESLVFDSGLSCTTEALNSIVETLNYLCHAYYSIQNWSFISASFTQYLIELILLKVANNYTHQLNERRQEVMPSYMRKAQQYIQQHLQSQISLAKLSIFAGLAAVLCKKALISTVNKRRWNIVEISVCKGCIKPY